MSTGAKLAGNGCMPFAGRAHTRVCVCARARLCFRVRLAVGGAEADLNLRYYTANSGLTPLVPG